MSESNSEVTPVGVQSTFATRCRASPKLQSTGERK